MKTRCTKCRENYCKPHIGPSAVHKLIPTFKVDKTRNPYTTYSKTKIKCKNCHELDIALYKSVTLFVKLVKTLYELNCVITSNGFNLL